MMLVAFNLKKQGLNINCNFIDAKTVKIYIDKIFFVIVVNNNLITSFRFTVLG